MAVPIDGNTIFLFTLAFFIALFTLGEAVRSLLSLLKGGWIGESGSIFSIICIDTAFATTLIPILVFAFTLIGLPLNTYSAVIVLFIAALVSLFSSRKEISRFLRKGLGVSFSTEGVRSYIKAHGFSIFASAIFLVIMFIYLFPTVGLYVYPADDAKMHTFITELVVENNGYPSSFGRYAFNPSPTGITYPLGFHMICAFFYFLTSIPVEGCVLLITQIYNGLGYMAMFFFAEKLFKSKYSGLFSAIFLSLVSSQPMFFFGWGGNAELLGNYLLLIFLGLHLEKMLEERRSADIFVASTIIFAGMLYIHEFSALYCLCCIFPLTLYRCLRQRSFKPALEIGTILTLAFVLDFTLINRLLNLGADAARIELSEKFSDSWFSQNQFLGPELLFSNNCLDNVWDVFQIWFGLPLIIFSSIGLLYMLMEKNIDVDRLVLLFGWLIALIAIHENGPYGLYLIKFPFWHLLFPNRFFLAMGLPLSCAAGFCLQKFNESTASSLEGARKKNSFLRVRITNRLWVIPIVIVLVHQASINVTTIIQYQDRAAVTDQDYRAFMWIRENTPTDAAFYVTDADAGQWIPSIAQRRVFPIVANSFVESCITEDYFEDTRTLFHVMMTDPNNDKALSILDNYDITHVFIGAKSIFERQQLNFVLFLNSTHYRLVHHIEGEEVYIFKVVSS